MKEKLQAIAEKIRNADAILIGASNGLSITEGLHLFADNEAFENLFGDLKRRYGICSILQGMMAHWSSEEEKWGFWSRLLHRYCTGYQQTPVMSDLRAITEGKDYFIVTSNGECHFEMSGFDPEKIFEIEGNWLNLQCSEGCHETLYPWSEMADKMAAAEKDGRIPSELVPHCPHCGGPMQVHLQTDAAFIPEHAPAERLNAFLQKYRKKNLVVLELGIGARNQLIKAPLMNIVNAEPHAAYITINLGEIYIPEAIQQKSFGLDGYLSDWLKELRRACEAN